MERLADGGPNARDPVARHEPGVLVAEVLERACERSGFDWRKTDLTIDQAIDALPADLAEATVRAMHDAYETDGDRDNAMWTAAKLREIQALALAHRKLQALVTARFRDEFIAKAGREGVSSELTEQFMDQFVATEMPTVAALRDAHPELVAFRPAPDS